MPSGPIERHVDFELGLGTLEIQTSNFNTYKTIKHVPYDVLLKEKASMSMKILNEPVHEKNNNLHRRKQSRRSASR